MAAEGMLEAEIVLKSPSHWYFQRLSKELDNLPDAISDKVHRVEVHEGDFKTNGSNKFMSAVTDHRDSDVLIIRWMDATLDVAVGSGDSERSVRGVVVLAVKKDSCRSWELSPGTKDEAKYFSEDSFFLSIVE